jgi:hypothetical protein
LKGRAIVMTQTEKSIIEAIAALTEAQQQDVLRLVQTLMNGKPRGVSGQELIRRAANIAIPPEDLEEMKRAIEEGCEQIDDEW